MEEGQAEAEGGAVDANGTEKRHKKKKDKKKKKSKKKDGEAENGMDGVVLDDAAAAAGNDDVENDPVRLNFRPQKPSSKAYRGRVLNESGVAQGYQAFLREVAVEEAKAAREEAGGQPARKGKKKK